MNDIQAFDIILRYLGQQGGTIWDAIPKAAEVRKTKPMTEEEVLAFRMCQVNAYRKLVY